MTSQYRQTDSVWYRHLSRLLPYLAPVLAVCGTAAPFLLGLRTFAIVSLYASVPIVVASGVYFGTNRLGESEHWAGTTLSLSGLKLTVIAYLLLHAGALVVLAGSAVRPFAYYGLVSLTAVVILFQILHSPLERRDVSVILVETGVLLTSVLWSVTLNYHYYFGRTDVFPHHRFVQSLLETHHVTGAFGAYQPFPLWHVLVGFQTMLFGEAFEPLTLFFLTTGVVYALAPPVVYRVSRRFGFSRMVSLVGALGLCLNPFVLLYGMYAIPRSVTSFLLLFCALLLLTEGTRASVLYVGLLLGIAMYHTVSLPFVFVVFGCYYVVERLLRWGRELETDGPVVTTWQLLAIPFVQLAYWQLTSSHLISRIVAMATSNSTYRDEVAQNSITTQFIEEPFHELVNYLPFGLILLFVLFGVMQSDRVSKLSMRNRVVLLTGLLLVGVSVPGPALLVSVFSDLTADMIFRFGQYSYPFVAISFAVGVVAAVRTRLSIGSHEVMVAVVLLLVGSTVFLGVSNDFVASDNPLSERDDFYTFYLTEPEVNGFHTIAERSETPVTGDYITCRYVDNLAPGDCEIIQADPSEGRLHFPPDSVFVLRTAELEDRPLSIYPTEEPVSAPPYSNNRESLGREDPVWDGLERQNRLYDSSELTAYRER